MSVERSSGKLESCHDPSNGDQGTRMDSPLLGKQLLRNSSDSATPKKETRILNQDGVNDSEKPMANSIKDLLKNRSQRILQSKNINVKTQRKMRLRKRNPKFEGKEKPTEIIASESDHIKKNSKQKQKK